MDSDYRSDVANFLYQNPTALHRYQNNPTARSSANFVYDNIGVIAFGLCVISGLVIGLATYPKEFAVIAGVAVGLFCLYGCGRAACKRYKNTNNERISLFQSSTNTEASGQNLFSI